MPFSFTQLLPSSRLGLPAFALGWLAFRFALHPIAVDFFERQLPPRAALASNLPWLFVLGAGLLLLGLSVASFLLRRSGAAALSRSEAAALFALVWMWPAPMIFDAGALLGDDWYLHQRAVYAARDSIAQGQWPGWTFLYSNGTGYALQYPPTVLLGIASLSWITRLPVELSFKLFIFLAQGLFLWGLYRLLRRLGLDRAPCLGAIAVLSFTQQYWASAYLHGASPTFFACALIPHSCRFLLDILEKGRWRAAAALGICMGLALGAQPVTAYFTAWLLAIASIACTVSLGTSLLRRLPALAFSVGICLAIASPFLYALVAWKSYNAYSFDKVANFQVASVSLLRWLWWNPRIGTPPGIGLDSSGYVGLAVLLALAIVLWRFRASGLSRPLLFALWLAWGLLLVYGAPWKLSAWIPFIQLAKGTSRLWPFLCLPLAWVFAQALQTLWAGHHRRWAWFLLCLGLLENAPFTWKPNFRNALNVEAALGPELPADPTLCSLLILPSDGDTVLFQNVFRWITQTQRAEFSYIHHEDIGATGKAFWPLHQALAQGPSSPQWEDSVRYLRQVGITHLLIAASEVPDYSSLGSVQALDISGHRLTLVKLSSPRLFVRRGSRISYTLDAAALAADGSFRFPVSYQPFLGASTSGGSTLRVRNDAGYAAVCCLPQSAPLQVSLETNYPAAWRFCFALSLVVLPGMLSFCLIRFRRR